MALPEDYRDYFIRNLHDALSGHSSNNVAEAVRLEQLDGFTCRPLRSSCVYITNRQSILECNLHTITIKTNCWEGLIFIDFINKMRRKMQKCVFKIMRFCRYSEKSRTKCIGITIETRPDYCLKRHLGDMLNYGCTRLEIGVQSVYEDVARDTNRGHTVRAVCESFQQAKDAGECSCCCNDYFTSKCF